VTHHEVGVEIDTTMTKRKMTKGQTTESINVLISNSMMIHLQCRIFNQHLTPRTTYTLFLSCKTHDVLSVVQIQNNEKWKKQMPAAQKNNLKVIHGFFFISKC
jgi:hypothetical protein